jgi:hypothetical protein
MLRLSSASQHSPDTSKCCAKNRAKGINECASPLDWSCTSAAPAHAQVADEEVARVPGWLARVHCPDLCLSCHFCSPAGYLVFSHGAALPVALLQSAFADYKQWSYEADFDGHEGVFYTCGATKQLNMEVGDLEQRVVALEVRATRGVATSAVPPQC